ncbi:MAG: hypothetical protein ACU843_02495 [Gammaproteobacteria bacterium]
MRYVVVILILLTGLVACDFGGAPDYEYRSITADSPYSDWKKDQGRAMESARRELEAFTKSECRRAISNGWSLSRVKNEGEMNCETTPEGHHCRKKHVELECRQVSEFFP